MCYAACQSEKMASIGAAPTGLVGGDGRISPPASPIREHPASRSPGHSRASSTSSIEAVPTKLPTNEEQSGRRDLNLQTLAGQLRKDSGDGEQALTPTPAQTPYPSFASVPLEKSSSATHHASPLRHETTDQDNIAGSAIAPDDDASSSDEDDASTQVTFSIPGKKKNIVAATPSPQHTTESDATNSKEEKDPQHKDKKDNAERQDIYAPAHEANHHAHEPLLAAPAHLHSILKTSHSPISSSRRSSFSECEAEASNTAANAQRHSVHLQPPVESRSPRRKNALGSHSRSNSPASDRTRLVGGADGYGGRQGGPTMDKSRTSSSGGLSDGHMRPGYERKVGFDTMIDADDTPTGYFTFCLQVKSRGYRRNKNTRTFMCAVDDNSYSERALEWLMDSLVSDGDEIVALRVLDGDPDEIDQDAARDEARDLMARIVQLNDEYGDRSISVVVEFVAGRVTNTILQLIYMYRPDSLTVGTRGRSVSTIQKIFGNSYMGSCSRDILNRSPVPVVIVRPEAKVKKHLTKRQNDPRRRSYHDLVALSKDDQLPLSVSRSSHKHTSKSGHQ